MIRRAKTEALLRPFKGLRRLRGRDSGDGWFPVEFLTYYDEKGNLRFLHTCEGKTEATSLTVTTFSRTNSVNAHSGGGSGKASGNLEGATAQSRVDECNGDFATVSESPPTVHIVYSRSLHNRGRLTPPLD